MTQGTESNVPPVIPLPSAPAAPAMVLAYSSNDVPTQDERTMAMLIWLLGLLSGWIGPLIIWLVKREQSKFVDFHGKQALFLHIAAFVVMMPMIVLFMIPIIGCLIFPLIMLVAMGMLALQIVLAVKANSGEWYRLPVLGGLV